MASSMILQIWRSPSADPAVALFLLRPIYFDCNKVSRAKVR
jgi:hypothetical protein